MLFPQDSSTYKKVQMQEEAICIQIYKGFAVVKGKYKMVNSTSEKLNFTMGYPINGIYNGGEVDLNQVQLDSLYKFKIKANGNELPINQVQIGDSGNARTFQNENWLTWFVDFNPNENKEIEVYFLVNTNEAGITKGYSREQKNAFIYLQESGSVWKQPIEKGNFIIELKDGLKVEDIARISSHFNFQVNENENVLIGSKTNFSPTLKDNLVITYGETISNFDFQKYVAQSEDLFDKIDAFSKLDNHGVLHEFETRSPYEVKTDFWGFLPGLIIILIIAAPFLIISIVVFIVVKLLRKRKKINI